GRGLAALPRPALTVEADDVRAIGGEAQHPRDAATRPHPAALEVSPHGVDGAARVNRLAGARAPDGVVETPDQQRIEDGLEPLAFRCEPIPDLTLSPLLALDDAVRFERPQPRAQPLRRDRGQRAAQITESPRAGQEIADDEQRPFLADDFERAGRRAEVPIAEPRPRRCRPGGA